MRIATFLILAVLGALGAVAAAWAGSAPALLSGSLAVGCVGLAGAAAATAVRLGASDDLSEPRRARGPSPVPATEGAGMTRPVFGRLWLAAAGAFALLGFVPLISLARKPGRRTETGWRVGLRLVDEQNQPIRRDRLVEGGIATVFPADALDIPDAAAVLIRMPPGVLQAAGATGGATSEGYVAYSKTCTHAGCPVAQYHAASYELLCPCHQSRFDALRGAKNISGPAPRALPQLPLDVDGEGYLVARAGFNGPVGPDDWDRVQ